MILNLEIQLLQLEQTVNLKNLRLFTYFSKQLLHVGMVGMFTKLLVGMGFKKTKLSEN